VLLCLASWGNRQYRFVGWGAMARLPEGIESEQETLVVEDSSRGLSSAVAAGIDCAVVYNDFTREQDFSAASDRIAALIELKDIIQRMIEADPSGGAALARLRSGWKPRRDEYTVLELSHLALREGRQRSLHPAHQPVHHERVQLIWFDEAEGGEFIRCKADRRRVRQDTAVVDEHQ
jgi:hypothetical protein